MKEIKLTQGKIALVDDSDYDELSKWKWCAHKVGGIFYAVRNEKINGKNKTISMHRNIFNFPKDKLIDHKDHDGLNNQKINLRVCNRSQNQANSKSRSGSVSKYLGVNRFRDRWQASITANYKSKNLGIFATEEEAAFAYNEAARKIHKEFANLNLIQS